MVGIKTIRALCDHVFGELEEYRTHCKSGHKHGLWSPTYPQEGAFPTPNGNHANRPSATSAWKPEIPENETSQLNHSTGTLHISTYSPFLARTITLARKVYRRLHLKTQKALLAEDRSGKPAVDHRCLDHLY